MIIQIIAAFFGTLLFAVVFNVARKELLYCGITGALGWFVYLMIEDLTKDIVFSSFIATVMISVIAQFLARVRKNPVTVFQIGGIFPLVPGAGMYKTLYYIVDQDYSLASQYLFETLAIAGSIAFGMVLISSLNKLFFRKSLS